MANNTRILGIDPGLVKLGWGIIEFKAGDAHFIGSGVIRSNPTQSIDLRMLELATAITDVITKFSPNEAAIEETYVNNNPRSSLALGQARGALMLCVAQNNLRCFSYEPRLIKKAVTGSGKSEKQDVQRMIKLLVKNVEFLNHDAADAIAIAYCHHLNSRFSQVGSSL